MSTITLIKFLAEQQTDPALCRVIGNLTVAAQRISRELAKARLHSDNDDQQNVHGEAQHALDRLANQAFKSALSGVIYLSEEEPEPVYLSHAVYGESLIVAMDPLDGSANIGLNLPLGSIFSVYPSAGGLLQKGDKQLVAGYFLYGSQTNLVFTLGGQVHGFTLDAHSGACVLSRPDIRIPADGQIYSVNEGVLPLFSPDVQRFIIALKLKRFNLRYCACLVADVHRILLEGGIYLYPGTTVQPSGKLRLVYEGHPLALILEAAGGAATDGQQHVLNILPESIHQRSPLLLGSAALVTTATIQTKTTYETL